MVYFNWFGLVVIILNFILTFLVSRMRRIGVNRGAGISGWISALIGVLILVFYKTPLVAGVSASIALMMGIISIFAILFIIIPALSPHMNLGPFRYVSKSSRLVGWVIGYITAILVGVLT